MGFIVVIHVFVCIALIVLVLIQRGKGGGLVESFSGIESMLGTKTNSFLTRSTTVLSVIFFLTCLSLALLSVKQSKSLLQNAKTKPAAVKAAAPVESPLVPGKPKVPEATSQTTATQETLPVTPAVVDQVKQETQKAKE